MIFYSRQEDLWNAWSHAVGILLGVIVGGALLFWSIRSGDIRAIVGMVLYLAGMLACYVASTSYHAQPVESPSREVLRRWDHAAIYWHIAGSYSPMTLVAMRAEVGWGWWLFAFVWLVALGGTIASFRRLSEHSHLETACYVGMGLSVLVAFRPLMRCVDSTAIAWLVAEGVFYVTGAVIYALSPGRPFVHSVFHFFVLGGTVCHLACLWVIFTRFLA